jgi:TonB family protein
MTFRIALYLTLLSTLAFAGQKEQRAKELADRAAQVSFSTSDGVPFHETAKFTRDFLDASHHRERMVVGDYEEIWVTNGDQAFRKNADVKAPPDTGLVAAFAPPYLAYDPNDKIAKVFKNKAGLDCVEIKGRTDCYDTGGFLAATSFEKERVLYWDFKPFGSKQVPSRFEVQYADRTDVQAEVEFRTGLDLTREVFEQASKGLKPGLVGCASPKAPRVYYSPDPVVSKPDIDGTVVLWAKIGQDGRANDIKVVRSLNPTEDGEAIEAVRTWKFKPATCDGNPVTVQINIEVNFRVGALRP